MFPCLCPPVGTSPWRVVLRGLVFRQNFEGGGLSAILVLTTSLEEFLVVGLLSSGLPGRRIEIGWPWLLKSFLGFFFVVLC